METSRQENTRSRWFLSRACVHQLGKGLQLFEQFASERLLRLKLECPFQLVPGGLVLSIGPQGHSQSKITLDQIWLQPDGFVKSRNAFRTMAVATQAQSQVEPGFGKVRLYLDNRAKTGL